MNASLQPPTVSTWPARNQAALDLGLDWLRAILAGQDAAAPRAAYDAARAAMRTSGAPAAIDLLSHTFGLAPFDEDCLLLAAAPFLDGTLLASGGASPQMALALFAGADPRARQLGFRRLAPVAPLRHWRLVTVEPRVASLLAPLAVDERVARALAGEDDPDTRLLPLRIALPPSPCPPRQLAAAETLAEMMRTSRRPVAVLLGPPRCGCAAVATAAAAQLGLRVVGLSPSGLPEQGPAQLEVLALLAREAALRGEALLLEAAKPETRAVAIALLHGLEAPLFVLSTEPLPEAAGLPVLRPPPLQLADRAALWRQALGAGAERLGAACERLADQYPLAPSAIAAIAAATQADETALWAACREAAGDGMGLLAERTAPRFGWDDIVLPAAVQEDLRAIAAQVRDRALVYGRGGFARRMPGGLGVAALFAGPSGTGKTLAAEVVAGELGLDLCRIDLSGVVSKYIGETERNLRAVFDAAECGGVALFFDEADALFGQRSEVRDSHDRYANLEVSYLLQRMERFSGLAILATNMKAHLDAAFLRRLRHVVDFPFPDTVQRRVLWQRSFPPETETEGLDYDALARLEIAGGNIAVIAVNAAFLAAAERGPVRMAHVLRAARAEFRKLDKELRGPRGEAL